MTAGARGCGGSHRRKNKMENPGCTDENPKWRIRVSIPVPPNLFRLRRGRKAKWSHNAGFPPRHPHDTGYVVAEGWRVVSGGPSTVRGDVFMVLLSTRKAVQYQHGHGLV